MIYSLKIKDYYLEWILKKWEKICFDIHNFVSADLFKNQIAYLVR